MTRYRSHLEILSRIGEKNDDALYQAKLNLQYGSKDYDKIIKLIEYLEKIDKKELNSISEGEVPEEVKEDLLFILNSLETAESLVKKREDEKLVELLEKLHELEKKAYEEINAYNLNERYTVSDKLGRGGSRRAYSLEGYSDRLMLTEEHFSLLELQRYYNQQKQVPDSVNLAKTLKIGFYTFERDHRDNVEKLVRIDEKAPGIQIRKSKPNDAGYDRASQVVNRLASDKAPISHYKGLVKDINKLRKYNLAVDLKNPENLFHDENQGFTIIDISRGRWNDKPQDLYSSLTYTLYGFYGDQLDIRDLENIDTVRKKLEKAGLEVDKEFKSQIREMKNRISN